MRSPHHHANAGRRRGGWGPWSLGAPALLAAAAGCVMQQAPAALEGGEAALERLGAPAPPVVSVARPTGGPAAPGAVGPTSPPPMPIVPPDLMATGAYPTPPSPAAPTPTERPYSAPKLADAPRADAGFRRAATATAPAAPGRSGGSERPDHRVVIAAARRVATVGTPAAQPPDDGITPDERRAQAESEASAREPVPAPAAIPPPSGVYPIDLPTALRLADAVNPTINRMRSVVLEALALQLTARTLLVPSLNGSPFSYHGHNGNLQRSSGKILNLSEQSLFMGAGAFTVAAETVRYPGVNIASPLTDAFFEPLVARQRVIASRFNVRATENDILLDVALLQLELMRHYALLEAHRLSELQAYQIVQAIEQYAITGQGRQSDFDRARAEWRYRRADVIDAEQGVGVAAARLAQRLNLDPAVRLQPAGGPLIPLHLIELATPPEELIQVALEQRPDLAARTAEIGQAEWRVKEEIGRPLLPTLWVGYSGGIFGGGSNLVPPLLGNFRGRDDFDVRLFWTFMGAGLGNVALIKERQAEVGQAVATRARTINRARDEVMAAVADARAALNQIEIARRELLSSHEGFHEDLVRSRENLGRPIEVINSLNLLAEARAHLIDAIVRYDQSQFRIWVALGTPPPLVETSSPEEPAVPDYLKP